MGPFKVLARLLETLLFSLPSLANVGSLLLLLFTVYAVLGKHLFWNVERQVACAMCDCSGTLFRHAPWGTCRWQRTQDFVNEHAHFEDFGTAMITLFRMTTGAPRVRTLPACLLRVHGRAGSRNGPRILPAVKGTHPSTLSKACRNGPI